MKNSIRTKLFWGISSLIGFFVLLSWLLNFNFLDKYFIFQKRMVLQKEFQFIDENYHGNITQVREQFEKLVRTTGINIVIFDQNLTVKSAFFPRPPGLPAPQQQPTHRDPPFVFQNIDWSKPAFHIDRGRGDRNTQFLNFTAKLHNGDVLWLGTPLPEMRQSVAISNQFFLITGFLTIIIGGLTILFYAKKFTRPILELDAIAQNMAKLDFTKMYSVKTQDEIGELGRSLNSLSAQLGRSIHELQQANRKLEEDNERQRKIDENRKEFISNVSHELKTPIALIQGYAEGLKLNVTENEADKNFYCDVIMDEATKMNKLVRDLLDLAEIDSGYLRLDMEIFDLAQLMDRVLEKYQLIFKDKGITLVLRKEDGAYVNADFSRIEQVLVNYINNAVEHIEGNRILKISVRVKEEKVQASIFNSGKPIPEAALEKIWFSFYKVDQARTRDYGGTGLGLSIVQAVLEHHHGCYGVRNLPDGVEFWFELQHCLLEPNNDKPVS